MNLTDKHPRNKHTNAPSAARFAVSTLSACLVVAFSAPAQALPTGGVVAAGAAGIANSASATTISQTTANAVINWQSFGIGAGQTVQFIQPSSSSVALNRVLGSDPSSILGNLSANGKVFLLNPNGVLFGNGASVNVGGLVASTMSITDANFMAGRYAFTDAGNGTVVNQGTINAADGGYVALMGKSVSNQGVISARMGTVALGAGNAITMDISGDGLLNLSISQGAVNALIENGGMIRADGGRVLLTAQAAGDLLQTVVNNTGVIQAQSIGTSNGAIFLLGDMQSGTVSVGGTLDASAPNGGNGGFIETSAANVKIPNAVKVTTAAPLGLTGTWLIDPADYAIAAAGGDITGAQLSANLANNNVIIMSSSGAAGVNGDIIVADTVNWSANRLTLNAQRNININTAMNGSNTASLSLLYGQAAVATGNLATYNVLAPINLPDGPNFSTQLGFNGAPVNYTVISNLGGQGSVTTTDLQGMKGNLSGNYALGGNINAAATVGFGAFGFDPVGSIGAPFAGNFDGLGHTITGLTISRPLAPNVGMFGFAVLPVGAALKNVTMTGGSVAGGQYVGNLVGHINGNIVNSHASQTVTGNAAPDTYVGGIAGWSTGDISNSSSTGTVNHTGSYAGGLVGWITGNITCCFATGPVQGAGGLYVGGLAGWVTGNINRSYATGPVTAGGMFVGGLGGWVTGNTSNSYATGSVTTAGINVGGLIGWNDGNILNSFSSGRVTGAAPVGGLVGFMNGGVVTNSYWDIQTSNQPGSAGGVGRNTANMRIQGNYVGWDFANIWNPPTAATYPTLQACLAPATFTAVPAPAIPGIVPGIIPGIIGIPPYIGLVAPALATFAYVPGLVPTYATDAGNVFFAIKEEEVFPRDVAPVILPPPPFISPPPPYVAPRYVPKPARN